MRFWLKPAWTISCARFPTAESRVTHLVACEVHSSALRSLMRSGAMRMRALVSGFIDVLGDDADSWDDCSATGGGWPGRCCEGAPLPALPS
eukprot:5118443-Pleurochrysis_carterae.AAC.2